MNRIKFMIMLIKIDEMFKQILPKSKPSHLVVVVDGLLVLTVKYIVLVNIIKNKRTKQLVVLSFLVSLLCSGLENIENHK